MKASAEKSSSTTSKTTAQLTSQPFFAKAGGGDFFAPAIQMKMEVNRPGDKFEQEADKMADKVMRMPAPPPKEEKLQRQPEEKLQKKEEDKIQKASMPEEKLQKATMSEEKVQKKEDEKLQKAALPEEKIQKKEEDKIQKAAIAEEKIQKAAMSEEKLQKKEDEKLQKAPAIDDKLQRKGSESAPSVTTNIQSAIHNKTTGGQPLSSDVRSYMEPRFNADFSNVRVHHDAESASLNNQLSARAFTYQNHVFFSRDQYQPGTSEGKQLLAHELTHTIQQGHTVQRSPQVSTTSTPPPVQRLGVQDALDYFADKAYLIPGFRLLTIVLGFNPINMRSADRNAANLLRGLIELIPGGAFITQALDNHGVINKAADWVEQKIAMLGDIGSQIAAALKSFIDSLSWTDIFDLGGVWERAKHIFTDPISQLKNFGIGVAVEILKMVKDAILKPLAALAQGTRGYDLLKAILGEDPITGEPVPRNAETLIGGFMKLIGQEEVWENLKKGKAIQRAWAWFQGALEGLMGFVRTVPRKIIDTITSLTFQDIVTVAGAFTKVVSAFVNIATDFICWGLNQVISLLEILFSVVAPGVMPYITKAKAAFHKILKDPIGFVGNLVRAGKQGFEMFAGNILEHLKAALIKWLVGPLADAGVYIPKSFSLLEIVKLVLSVLGLTWQAIRSKLVKIIPEPVLVGLEKTAGILVTLVKDGPAAAWEQIKVELSELKDQLIGQITQMVTTEVVKAAVVKLVMMLNPAGAVVEAIVAIYKTITFFIEKAKQIAAVVASFIDSISAIAAGQIMPAAKRVEQTMANTLTIIIAFLAKYIGLGNIPEKVVGVVKKIRQPIDKGLDKIVGWLGNMLKKIGGAVKSAARAIALRFTQRRPFTAGSESHSTWVSEEGEPQIATVAMPLESRISDWRSRLSNLSAADRLTARPLLSTATTINRELKAAARDALRARTQSNAPAVDAAQAIIDTKQAALVPVLSQLFNLFGELSAGRSPAEAQIFALVETYDRVVVPLKQRRLITGVPAAVSNTFKSQWNNRQFPQARGWILQMERVLAAARNVGTPRLPRLTGVEVKIPGTEIDYTIRDHDTANNVEIDVAIEVKRYGAMRDITSSKGKITTVADQIQSRIATLRRQVNSSLDNPAYSMVVLEMRGYSNTPPAMQSALTSEMQAFTNRAITLGKQFQFKMV
jgi:hypothetical protein